MDGDKGGAGGNVFWGDRKVNGCTRAGSVVGEAARKESPRTSVCLCLCCMKDKEI